MTGDPATPADGPAVRADDPARLGADVHGELSTDLHEELDRLRLAWGAALLRTDVALTEGDADAVDRGLAEHHLLLDELEAALLRTVARALTARERPLGAGAPGRLADARRVPRRG